ncbi:bifunctional DNA primase/polymerase [Umezawaea sp. NPDC059074]|uniref:bifunctional DNA primase/polymerase n=1 Tax=Umezawaea sp. NPDC059074 TaxID=3346716 RepID=UPI00367A957F
MSDHAATARRAETVLATERGWYVFPLIRNDKPPAVTDWENKATNDPDRARWFWTTYPHYNVGIATGPSNLVVVDLDIAKTGQVPPAGFNMLGVFQGSDVLDVLAERARATIPATYTVRTPSGGTHLYYRAPAGVKLRNTQSTLGWLIDTRAHGGYVVGSVSVLPHGGYELVDDQDPVPLPTWLHQALTAKPAPATTARRQTVPHRRGSYLYAIVRAELAKVAAAQRARHNKTVFEAALTFGQLVAGGELGHAESFALLEEAATHIVIGACDCTASGIAKTIRSGLKLGATQPRRLESDGGVAA